MKISKHLATIVESTKFEVFYFKRADLKALFELYYKVDNIHIGHEWEYSGLYKMDIPSINNCPSKPDKYDEWYDRLNDMFYASAIPKGIYLIESDYYSDGCG